MVRRSTRRRRTWKGGDNRLRALALAIVASSARADWASLKSAASAYLDETSWENSKRLGEVLDGKLKALPAAVYTKLMSVANNVVVEYPLQSNTAAYAPPEQGLVAGKSYKLNIPLGIIPNFRNGDTVTYKSTREGNDGETIYVVTKPSDNDPGMVYTISGAEATLVPVKGGSRRKTLRRRK